MHRLKCVYFRFRFPIYLPCIAVFILLSSIFTQTGVYYTEFYSTVVGFFFMLSLLLYWPGDLCGLCFPMFTFTCVLFVLGLVEKPKTMFTAVSLHSRPC